MKYLPHDEHPQLLKWLDSRLYSPTPTSTRWFEAEFLIEKEDWISPHSSPGWARWTPVEGYTDGYWAVFRSFDSLVVFDKGFTAEVLYWIQRPSRFDGRQTPR